ncbi:ABC transporter ATP-binding protein [Bacillus weihaiensis]|uniref:ABC transporter ATP-binding protein n=1 Tax=Bacillus weihaiensis TaxID=1547283 RepID=UPI002352A781|nr:ABC transporter ATP-binding protein [Bacillus weihaiensis]
MIEIKNLRKSYFCNFESKEILSDMSLIIEEGQWCTIIGPSGTGKSTFLNCVSGLLKPDSGEIIYEGINLYNLKEEIRSEYRRLNIGFIFQDFKLLPHYSVLDNVALPLIYDEPKTALYLRAKRLLDTVGMKEDLFNRLPEGLSGGEKQRVAIARALIANPKVLICDEPTGNLDIDNRNIIIELLKEFKNKGQTIIMVTHDEEVAQYGDITYKLYLGNLETNEGTI